MARIDENNWVKTGIEVNLKFLIKIIIQIIQYFFEKFIKLWCIIYFKVVDGKPKMSVVVTVNGYSDWST